MAEVPGVLPRGVPQIYISRTVSFALYFGRTVINANGIQPVSHTGFDIDLLGDCDVVVSELCRRAGWDFKHEMIPPDEKVEVNEAEGYESRHEFKVVGA